MTLLGLSQSTNAAGQPSWILFLRIAQGLVALTTIALTSFTASVFEKDYGMNPGYGLDWFTSLWTFLFLLYLIFGIKRFPIRWNPTYILMGLEVLTTLWWIATLALLASAIAGLNADREADIPNCDFVDGSCNFFYWTIVDLYGSRGVAAVNTYKAAAAFAGLEVILFFATIVVCTLALMRGKRAGYPGQMKRLQDDGQGEQIPMT